jgi:hypothetical protein
MAKRIATKPTQVAKKPARTRAHPSPSPAKPRKSTAKPSARDPANPIGPRLLSGGNPQITKADGDAPVQAFIAAMPGWKQDVGRRLDDLITRTVPGVRKAVRWNTPFYGSERRGWFLGFHCITRYVKIAFFRGTSLHPVPPVESKNDDVRYVHIHEGDLDGSARGAGTRADRPIFDEELLAEWIRQASELPGWTGFDC